MYKIKLNQQFSTGVILTIMDNLEETEWVLLVFSG